MSFLLSTFLGGTSTTGDSSYSDENKQLIVEKLTTKMTNSAHLEDRKAAAQTIKSLARSHRLEIGTLALQALIEELRRDLEDEELAKIVLETLDILCSSSMNENAEKIEQNSGIEVQFCEILLKDEGNVALLLDLMGNSEDFYLRFTSIQILISLCTSQPFQLQSAVLNSPSGVEKVLNLLKDSREIVRNEGLLLCEALVRGNSDLQKILAFQGAFEEVMKIIVEEEGPWTGPLIIQDAFNLISAMLNLNTSNQNYFRDSICFKQLAGLLSLPQGEDSGLWNSTKISNYLAALNILDGILCKENVDLEASQNAAMRTHFQGPLLILAFAPKIPLKVSASALKCLSGLIWSNNRAQQEFANEKLIKIPTSNCLMKIESPISPLMAAIILAVHGNATQEGVEQRIKSLEIVEAFCFGNSEGQLVLLSTLKASGTASPGTVILDALFDLDSSRKRDPWHCWYASILLCHLIDNNEEAKKVLLKHQFVDLEIEDEGEDLDLLTSLMLSMIRIATDSRGSTCQKSIIGYLQLLVIWFQESPSTIKAFLSESSFLQYLLERITQQPQELEIQGLSALILGICVLFNDETIERVGSEALKGIIKNRIGPDLFVSRLSRLKSNCDKNDLISELSKGILLKNYESLMNLVVRPTPIGTKASHTATLAQLSKDLVESRALLVSCQTHLSETSTLADKLKIGITERDAYILQLQKFISEKNQKIAQMAHEMSSHYEQQQQQQQQLAPYEKCLSDQAALKSLNDTIKSFQETVARQQSRIEELEALLKETEEKDGELEKWKEAYHKLYEQVQQQLNFVDVSGNVSFNAEEVPDDFENYTADATAEFDGNEPLIIEEYSSSGTTESLNVAVTAGIAVESLKFQNGDNIEVLSPSMFMSPLAESEAVLNEFSFAESSSENPLSPELVSVNQIPLPEAMNEYPSLTEEIDTSFSAAVIVSEEFANNEPNPSTDEVVETISSECPPDNFLASDPDENVEIVSSEEIKNVIRFFDDLSGESTEEDYVGEVQEELNQMNITDETKSVDQQVPYVIESTEKHINDSFELPTEMDGEEFDYYAESNFNNILHEDIAAEEECYEENESHLGYAVDHYEQTGELIDEGEKEQAGTQNYSFDEVQKGYDQSQEFTEMPQENLFTDISHKHVCADMSQVQAYIEEPQQPEHTKEPHQPEYTGNLHHQQYTKEPMQNQYTLDQLTHEQQQQAAAQSAQEQQYSEVPYSYDKQQEYTAEGSYAYDQQQEYTTEESYNYDQQQDYSNQEYNQSDQIHEPVASIDDYFSHEASQEFLQEYTVDQGQYTEVGAVYTEGQDSSADAYNQDQTEYQTEGYATDKNNEFAPDYATRAQEFTGEGQTYSAQELSNEGYAQQEYRTEGQDYFHQEYNADNYNQAQEYSTEGYPQTQEYSTDEYTQSQGIDNYAQPEEYSTDSLAQSQEYRADTQAQEYGTQDGSVDAEGYGQDYSASAYSTEAVDYSEYPAEYSATEYSQSSEYATTNQTNEYAQDQSAFVTQEQYQEDYIQKDQNAQDQVSEYYYYDEITGYTYGFDQNVNQYYYYDPNTGEYVYYTAPEAETTADNLLVAEVDESIASANPSLFETAGPPMVSLQKSTPHVESQLNQNFVIDPVYNL